MSVENNPHVVALRHAYRRWRETKGGSADEILALFDDRVEMRSVLTPEVPSGLAANLDRLVRHEMWELRAELCMAALGQEAIRPSRRSY